MSSCHFLVQKVDQFSELVTAHLAMLANICKKNKYSHCKFGRFCHFVHENRKCKTIGCDARSCDLRHPPKCRNILLKKACKFGKFCSFDHEVDIGVEEEDLSETIAVLEKQIAEKDVEIEKMLRKISDMEKTMIFKDTFSEDSSEEMFDEPGFQCGHCEFTTEHKVGLKIHMRKKHQFKCEVQAVEVFNLIANKDDDEEEFTLVSHSKNETCFGIVSNKSPREDHLPALYLHNTKCWDRLDQPCPNLPEARHPEDHPLPPDQCVVYDLDFYDPTLHILLDKVLSWDFTREKYLLDWTGIKRIIATC